LTQDNPQLLALGQNLLKERQEFIQGILDQTLPGTQDFLMDILKEGVKKGQIDPECNLAIAASMITSFNMTLMDLVLQSSIEEGIKEFLSKTDDMLRILRYGLGGD